MSRSVDEKVVKMSLENAGFKSKILSTLASITKLDRAFRGSKNIDLSRSVNSVNSLKGAVNRFSMRPISVGVESVKSHFSAMSVAAVAALGTIVSRATSAGINIAKSISIKPMADGFDMYENKLKTIQVIHANTGASVGKITGVLAGLNDYANKTVYSFKDMTTNLGTFTAAGVGLSTAKTDMIGLSNLAAASGSSTQQAAMAMYQLSQAVAAGKVGLQDWNSVVNAGMGGAKFQNALKKNGVEMGKNVKMTDNFRESLKKGWLTSDVLNKTLAQFANDKSMLKAATQAKTFSDVMDSASDDLKSGWAQTWELILGNYNQAPKLFTAMQTSISNMINKTAADRNKLLGDFVKLGGRTVVIKSLENALAAVGKVIHTVHQAFQDVFPPATGKSLLAAAKSFESFTKGMIMSSKTASNVRAIFRGMFSVLDIGIKVVKMVASALLGIFPGSFGASILSIAAKIANLITAFDKGLSSTKRMKLGFLDLGAVFGALKAIIGSALAAIDGSFGKLGSMFKSVYAVIKPGVDQIMSVINKLFSSITPDSIAKTGVIAAFVALVKNFQSVSKSLKKAIDDMTTMIHGVSGTVKNLDSVREALKAWTDQVKAKMLLETAVAMLAIAAAIKVLASIPAMQVAKGLEIIGVALTAMVIALRAISKIKMAGIQSIAATSLIMGISEALFNLSISLKIVSSINAEQLGYSLLTLSGMLVVLVAALNAMARIPKGPMISSAAAIVIMSGGILVLSGAVAVLSTLSIGSAIKGLSAMAVVLAEVAVFCKTVAASKLSPVTAAAVVIAASGVVIISTAAIALSLLPYPMLITGLSGLATILLELAAFSQLVNGAQLTLASVGLLAMASAVAIMVPPIMLLSTMPLANVAVALIALAGSLTIMVLALKGAEGSLAGAAAITIAAAGIVLLVPPLIALSSIPLAALAVGILGLAAALGVIVLASMGLQAGAVGLIALAAAMAAFAAVLAAASLALAAAGLAISSFAAALVVLAGLTSQQLAMIGNSFTSLLRSLRSQIPLIIQIGVEAVVGFAAGLATAIPSLASSGLRMILGLLGAIRDNIGKITIAAVEIIVNFATALALEAPRLAMAGLQLIVSLVNSMADGIRANSQQIVSAVLNMVEAIFEVIIDAGVKIITIMFGWIPGVEGAAQSMGSSAKSALRDTFDIGQVGSDGSQDFVTGINSHQGAAGAAGAGLSSSAKTGATGSLGPQGYFAGSTYTSGVGSHKGKANSEGNGLLTNAKKGATGDLLSQGSHAGSTYTSGVGSHKGGANSQGNGLLTNAKKGATGSLNSQGSHAGSTYNSGVGSHKGGANSAGSHLLSNAKRGSHGSLYGEGSFAGSGFVKGIEDHISGAWDAAARMASAAHKAISKILDEHSPSKVMYSLGDFAAQGFANGISDNAYLADNGATKMGQVAIDSAKAAVQGIKESLDNSLDYNLVVTPQLDTTAMKVTTDKANSYLASSIGAMHVDQATQTVKMVDNGLVTKMEDLSSEIRNDQGALRSTITNGLLPVTGILDALKEHYGSNEPIYLMMNDKVVGSVFGPVIDQKQGSTISLTRRGLAR